MAPDGFLVSCTLSEKRGCLVNNQSIKIHDKEFIPKIASDDIQKRVTLLAGEINLAYAGKNPVVIGVLTGASLFATDLFRKLNHPCELTFIRVASYHGGLESSGVVTELVGLREDITNRHVLLVEDIVDTGETAQHLLAQLQTRKPASVKLATALFKPAFLKHPVKPDFVGFEVGPDFLVGYGLDYNGLGRNLNDIYILKP